MLIHGQSMKHQDIQKTNNGGNTVTPQYTATTTHEPGSNTPKDTKRYNI